MKEQQRVEYQAAIEQGTVESNLLAAHQDLIARSENTGAIHGHARVFDQACSVSQGHLLIALARCRIGDDVLKPHVSNRWPPRLDSSCHPLP